MKCEFMGYINIRDNFQKGMVWLSRDESDNVFIFVVISFVKTTIQMVKSLH